MTDSEPDDSDSDEKETVYFEKNSRHHLIRKETDHCKNTKDISHTLTTSELLEGSVFPKPKRECVIQITRNQSVTNCTFPELMDLFGKGILSEFGVWIDFCCISESEILQLGDKLSLHPIVMFDILSRDLAIEKIDFFEKYSSFILSEPYYKTGTNYLGWNSIVIVQFKKTLITFHTRKRLVCLENLKVLLQKRTKHSSDWMVHSICDKAVDECVRYVERINTERDSIEELIYTVTHVEQCGILQRISFAWQDYVVFKTRFYPKKRILKSIIRHQNTSQRSRIFFKDVLDHIMEIIKTLDYTESSITSMNNIYLQRCSMLLNRGSNTVDRLMNKMTIAAMLFLPVTCATGFYGMNVNLPGTTDDDMGNYMWFTTIMVIFVVFDLLLYVFLKAIKWA